MFTRVSIPRLLLAASLTLTMSVGMAMADGKNRKKEDHDEVYEAQRKGDILPLATILARLRSVTGPEIVDVEFENKDGRPVYEIKFVDTNGRRKEIYVDARSATIVEMGDD